MPQKPPPEVVEVDEPVALPEWPPKSEWKSKAGKTYDEIVASALECQEWKVVWGAQYKIFTGVYREYLKGAEELAEDSVATSAEDLLEVFVEPIDHGLIPNERAPNASLRAALYELLLDHAAAYLERARGHRTRREDMAARAVTLALELHEYLKKDEVYRSRIRSGERAIRFIESVRRLESEKSSSNNSKDWKKYYDSMLSNFPKSPSPFNIAYASSAYMARASGLPTTEADNGKKHKITIATFKKNNSTRKTELHEVVEDRTVSSHLGLAATRIAGFSNKLQRLAHLQGIDGSINTYERSGHAYAAADAQTEYAAIDVEHQKRELAIATAATRAKLNAACQTGGTLNYAEQAAHAKAQYGQDLKLALRQVAHAAIGLFQVFGYQASIPSAVFAALDPVDREALQEAGLEGGVDKAGDVLGGAQTWVRDAMAWLLARRQAEHQFTTVLSLRKLLGDRFEDAFSVNGGTFTLTPEHFAGDLSIRLRAMAVEARSNDEGYWRVRVRLPRDAAYFYKDGNIVERSDVVQAVPPILLTASRVDTAGLLRWQVDESFVNSAPLGEWRVQVDANAMSGGQGADAQWDILLHLRAVTAPEVADV